MTREQEKLIIDKMVEFDAKAQVSELQAYQCPKEERRFYMELAAAYIKCALVFCELLNNEEEP